MSARPPEADRNQEATVYIGNLDEKATDALVWELMLQAGPVVNVHLPKDRVSMTHQGFGFCEFQSEEDADYAAKIMNQIKLFGKPIRVNKASYDRKQLDVGANLFVGNLDPTVDENLLYQTFSTFGDLAQPVQIARDTQTGESKGYAFVHYTDFDASDNAIEQMNGQYLMNKPVNVQYAFKKDGKGERHGTAAERMLAAEAKRHNLLSGLPPGYGGGQFSGALAPPPQGGAPVSQPPPNIPVYNGAPNAGFPPPPPPPAGFGGPSGQPGMPPMGYPPNMSGPPQGFPPPSGYAMPMQMQMQGYMGQPGMQPPPPPGFGMGGMGMPPTYPNPS